MQTHFNFAGIILMIIMFVSCANADTDKKDNIFSESLRETQIGKSDFVLSIPNNYSLTAKTSRDFTLYQLLPTDSLSPLEFSGGVYFGGASLEFKPEGDSCQSFTSFSNILDKSTDWTTYNCDSNYYIQTIIDSVHGKPLKDHIHAFGYAKSRIDLQKLFNVFQTLKHKSK